VKRSGSADVAGEVAEFLWRFSRPGKRYRPMKPAEEIDHRKAATALLAEFHSVKAQTSDREISRKVGLLKRQLPKISRTRTSPFAELLGPTPQLGKKRK
jgi:hypothetical protein